MGLFNFVKKVVEKFTLLASTYRFIRNEFQFKKAPIKTPWDFKLHGNNFMANGNFEPIETKIVRDLLQDVDVLINVGSNIGYYCCHALSMGKEVIAFEPLQNNLRYLCKNIISNGWKCEIYPIALSNQVEILNLYGGGTGASLIKGWAGSNTSKFVNVPCSTLDLVIGNRLQNKKILFIIDVEGAEYFVLEGAKSLLANNIKPKWLIEITKEQQQPNGVNINPNYEKTFNLMFEFGYKAITIGLDENIENPLFLNKENFHTNKSNTLHHNYLFI
jgi:FkbM family methyltransferase